MLLLLPLPLSSFPPALSLALPEPLPGVALSHHLHLRGHLCGHTHTEYHIAHEEMVSVLCSYLKNLLTVVNHVSQQLGELPKIILFYRFLEKRRSESTHCEPGMIELLLGWSEGVDAEAPSSTPSSNLTVLQCFLSHGREVAFS